MAERRTILKKRVPISADHEKVISQRLKSYKAGKSVPLPKAEMMQRLRSK